LSVSSDNLSRAGADHLYMPVWLTTLLTDTIVGVNLYLPGSRNSEPVLYRGADLAFTRDNRLRLMESGHKFLLIEKVYSRRYFKYIEKNLPVILDNPEITTIAKVQAVYHSAGAMMNDLFAQPLTKPMIERSAEFMDHTAEYLADRKRFHTLLNVMPANYRINTHSTSVCGITVALALSLGVKGKALVDCSLGALLHDVGKAKIHPNILNSPRRLDKEKMRIIYRHPQEGLAMINRGGPTPDDTRAIVLEHHESYDGSGYPAGKTGLRIHLNARIARVADVFAALTTNRPYGRGASTFKALQTMTGEMKGTFDPAIFREFVKLLGK